MGNVLWNKKNLKRKKWRGEKKTHKYRNYKNNVQTYNSRDLAVDNMLMCMTSIFRMFCTSVFTRISTMIVECFNRVGSSILILGAIIYQLDNTTLNITHVARGTLLTAWIEAFRFRPFLVVIERWLAKNFTLPVRCCSTSRISCIIIWGRQAWLLLVVIICNLNFVFIKEVSRKFQCSLQDISDLKGER